MQVIAAVCTIQIEPHATGITVRHDELTRIRCLHIDRVDRNAISCLVTGIGTELQLRELVENIDIGIDLSVAGEGAIVTDVQDTVALGRAELHLTVALVEHLRSELRGLSAHDILRTVEHNIIIDAVTCTMNSRG